MQFLLYMAFLLSFYHLTSPASSIMSFRRWRSILERQRAMNLTLVATVVLMEEAIGNDFLLVGTSGSSSSSSEAYNLLIINAANMLLHHDAMLVCNIDGGNS